MNLAVSIVNAAVVATMIVISIKQQKLNAENTVRQRTYSDEYKYVIAICAQRKKKEWHSREI